MRISELQELLWDQPQDAEAYVEVGTDGVGLAIWQDGERMDFIELEDDDE